MSEVPDFAVDYPERAETLEHTRLPFYCANCQRKRSTRYLTPNFGPFCEKCLKEIEKPSPLLQCTDCKNTESPAGAMARMFNHGRCVHCGGFFKVVRA